MEERCTSTTFLTLGSVISNQRKKLNLTLRGLEAKARVSYSHISKIERGESGTGKPVILKLAKALFLDENQLLKLSELSPNTDESENDLELDPASEFFLEDTKSFLKELSITKRAALIRELSKRIVFMKKMFYKHRR